MDLGIAWLGHHHPEFAGGPSRIRSEPRCQQAPAVSSRLNPSTKASFMQDLLFTRYPASSGSLSKTSKRTGGFGARCELEVDEHNKLEQERARESQNGQIRQILHHILSSTYHLEISRAIFPGRPRWDGPRNTTVTASPVNLLPCGLHPRCVPACVPSHS